MNENLRIRVRKTLDQLRGELLDARNEQGHWTGQLAASALSTATAVSALAAVQLHRSDKLTSHEKLIDSGIEYLRQQQNDDGGFGDTDRSYSNIATSYLVLAASVLATIAGRSGLGGDQSERLKSYIVAQGSLEGLKRRYGKDKTFVVPIMTNLAIAGLVSWDDVPRLPFEAAAVPQSLYRLVRMPVVSYAVPALVAIGQTRHFHGRRAFWPIKQLRSLAIARTLRVLSQMQPESGGYLEATPLTSFVVMSLAVTGRSEHPVSQRGVEFLQDSIAADGSWPIDTNLATWVTSLAMHSLLCDPEDAHQWCSESLVKWHLSCQHTVRHPFTGADPGGWGWTDLSGAVPDGDDTPGAILALLGVIRNLPASTQQTIREAIRNGVNWLLGLQNRDGGWPTFCRGWGKLPFDRSSTDLTAHALRAIRGAMCELEMASPLATSCARAVARGEQFLVRQQQADGSWLPLWFGNQDEPDDINPVYGTGRVLLSLSTSKKSPTSQKLLAAYGRGCQALICSQNPDGGWGGGSSVDRWRRKLANSGVSEDTESTVLREKCSTIEETAIALEGLTRVWMASREDKELFTKIAFAGGNERLQAAIIAGAEFLVRGVASGWHREPWPIGFYFAKLWYHERLYPWVFTVAALGNILRCVDDQHTIHCSPHLSDASRNTV
jgi:squalene-hopene/tetraprenyl-beta-curcumene cyclase